MSLGSAHPPVAPAGSTPAASGRGAQAAARIVRSGLAPAVLAWVCVGLLVLVASSMIDGFLTMPSIRSVLALTAILGIAAAGQTIVVIMGGIDLSIPALMTLTAVAINEFTGRGWNIVVLLIMLAVACIAIGALNGLLSSFFRVHPLIITLGVGFMVSGGLLAWTQGKPEGSVPRFLTDATAAASTMGPIPLQPLVAVWAAVALVTIVMATRTPFGRRVYAYGSSARAAEYALVRPRRLWVGVFAFSGLTAFVAGVMLAGFTGYGDLRAGDPYLFNTVAAVILGGTSLLGGRGGYGRSIAGSLMLILAQLILVSQGVEQATQQVALGALVVVLVAIYGRDLHVRDRV
ncbi:MAG: ABC transporter permease [Solirubrobacterales bacterium]|nr:ABC transporter permease [Solirubrobacterales bacterium]